MTYTETCCCGASVTFTTNDSFCRSAAMERVGKFLDAHAVCRAAARGEGETNG